MIEEISGDFLQWLRGFYYVAQTNSVSRAATRMGRNQPAISHQIKSLENEFEAELFERRRGKMTLTPQGEIVLEKAILVFELIKQMRNEIQIQLEDLEGRISIASTYAVIQHYLPPLIAEFIHRHPKVAFTLVGVSSEGIMAAVERAEVDFGLLNVAAHSAGMKSYKLFDTRIVLITAVNTRHLKSDKPSLEEIAACPLITFPDTSTIAQKMRRAFTQAGLEPREYMVLNNHDIIKNYVALDIGVSFLDEYAILDSDRERLRVVSLEEEFARRQFDLLVLRHKYLSPAVRAFIRFIKPGLEID